MSYMEALTSSAQLEAYGRSFAMLGRLMAKSLVATLFVWRERHLERRRFLQLDDRTLRDIGATREQIDAMARRPFWRV